MRRLFSPVGIFFLVILAVWLQMGWVRIWPIGSAVVNWVIIVVIAVTLFRSWWSAIGVAILAGVFVGQYSVWSGFVYPVAFIGMALMLRLIVQRLMAARSTASLIFAAAAATVLYYIILAGTVVVYRVLNQNAVAIVWPDWLFMMVVQSVVHPVIIYLAWRRFTGGSFSTPVRGDNVHQPFSS